MSQATPTRETIFNLLGDLPPESLAQVEQFVRSLKQNPPQGNQMRYPLKTVPTSSLEGWTHLLAEGYEGDALADSEALYDDV